MRRYQDHVYGVTLGILADFHLALDAAQEAFLCAYCDLPKLKDATRFGAWLCGIARNTAFEVRRDRRRQMSLTRKAADRARHEKAPSAQKLAVENEERTLVQRALQGIHEKDREALTLYYADGLDYAEICGFLGVSRGTLKGRLQRGRAALRKELIMVEKACKDNAPDESFARSLERSIRVFGAKGPPANHIPSEWHDSIHNQTVCILESGDEGFRVDLALSHSGSARQRGLAASRFGIRRDGPSLIELERMLEDRSARVRRGALVWYAAAIHPGNADQWRGPPEIGEAASTLVGGVDKLLARMRDENSRVRMSALAAVGAYRGTGDPQVREALRKALDDPKHKVRHAAARVLAVPCPGCGKTW